MGWIKCYFQIKCYYDYSNLHFLIAKRLHNILLQTSFLYLASSFCVYPCVCLFNLVIRLFWLLLLTVLKNKVFFYYYSSNSIIHIIDNPADQALFWEVVWQFCGLFRTERCSVYSSGLLHFRGRDVSLWSGK